MFGHVNYDSRIQTLWVANNRRDSLIALKIGFDVSASPSSDLVRGGFFEQVVEFSGPKPTIHFVILSADADPTGDEAHAACVAAKVPPGELALVAFSVHSTGVDQILVRKEWYESALVGAVSKFPSYTQPQVPMSVQLDAKSARQIPQAPSIISGSAPVPQQVSSMVPPGRLRTPPSEEIESELARDEARGPEAKGKGAKGKNVAFRDREEGRDKDKGARADLGSLSDSNVAQIVSKEIKKSEENLSTRIGRLITKEMDKQRERHFEHVDERFLMHCMLVRTTVRRGQGARTSRGHQSAGKDSQIDLDGAHKEYDTRGRDGCQGRGSELGPSCLGAYHADRGSVCPQRTCRTRSDGVYTKRKLLCVVQ